MRAEDLIVAEQVRGSRVEVIPNARHFMFEDDPIRFCAVVLEFLAG